MSKKYYYTSDEILKSIKRRIVIPESQNLFTDQDLLDFATEEMNIAAVPLINTQQENYFLTFEDVQIVSGQSRYEIPYRATGNKFKDLSFVSSSGQVLEMTEIDLGDLPNWNRSYSNNQAYAYYISSNEICLIPENNNFNGVLRFGFYIRTNALVPLDEVGVITSIDTNAGIVTVSEVPQKFTTTEQYDFIMSRSPHKIISYDNTASSVDRGTGQITFGPNNIPSSLRVGDHVALACESAIPNVPSDLHVMIAHRAAARVVEAIGDSEALQHANVRLGEMQQGAKDLIDNRAETSAKKIVARHGTIRNGLSRYKRRGTW